MTAVLSATGTLIMSESDRRSDVLLQLSARGRVLTVTGEIDASNADALRRAIGRLPDGDRTVVTEAVTFIDAAGLSTLVDAATEGRRDGTRLVLSRPGRAVRRIIELTETTELFAIER